MSRYYKISSYRKKEIGQWYLIGINSSYRIAQKFAEVIKVIVPDKVTSIPLRSYEIESDWYLKISRDLSSNEKSKLNKLLNFRTLKIVLNHCIL